MVDLTTPPLTALPNPHQGFKTLAWRGLSPYELDASYWPVKNADGQWQFDKPVNAGQSNAAIRLASNGNTNSGGYIGASATNYYESFNCELITGTGWVARDATASIIRHTGGNIEIYGNAGLTIGSAFSPTLRLTINGTTGALTLAGGGAAITGNSTIGGTLQVNGGVITSIPAGGWVTGQTASLFAGDSNNGFTTTNGGITAMRAFNGLRIETLGGTGRWDFTQAGYLHPVTDGYANLGSAALRLGTVFAVIGAINTSDEREKLWRGKPTDVELDAAWDCFNELGFYQWNNAIEEKGADRARFHFGLRAQRVWAIFANHGLVDPIAVNGKPGAACYGFFCYDEWGDEFEPIFEERDVPIEVEVDEEYESAVIGLDGEPIKKTRKVMKTEVIRLNVDTGEKKQTMVADDRFGFRPDQLDRLMMAALKRDSDRKEARISQLEAALAGGA